MRKRKKGKQSHPKNNFRKSKKKNKNFLYYLKGFSFWFVIYFISISLLVMLFRKTQIYQNKIGFSIIMGYLLVLISRIMYSATKNKELRLSGIAIWGFIYAIVFGVVGYFLNKIVTFNINFPYDLFVFIAIFSAVFTLILMFLRRMKIKKKRGGIKAPSRIFTGILLIVAGILSWRFSKMVFIDWFNWIEGMAWSWLIGFALIIAGSLVLIAWWRNNVSMFTTKHAVKWHR